MNRSFILVYKHKVNLFSFKFISSAFHRIADLKFVEQPKTLTSIKGWVTSLRKMKGTVFIDVQDGSSPKPLQVVVQKSDKTKDLSYGCSVETNGYLVLNKNKQLELQANSINIIGLCDFEQGYPFYPRKEYSNDYYRQYLHFRPRIKAFSSLLRIRNHAVYAVHDFFKTRHFLNIHTPIITSNDCEGAGEVFTVEPEQINGAGTNGKELFFNSKAFLTVSGQLHLEVVARSLNQVYCFGPTFRAENARSRLHLSEFYMVEAETSFVKEITDLTSQVEDMCHYITNELLDKCGEDIFICRKYLGELTSPNDSNETNTEILATKKFNIMSYDEASDILQKKSNHFKTSFVPNSSLNKEQEIFLVKHNGNEPLFIIGWPAKIKPFYMKADDDNPEKVLAFDLLCPNTGEICGGSLREDNYDKLEQSLKLMNLIDKLDWYLELRKYGNVLTGGFGLGFERYLQVLLNIMNIKDAIPFPRWPHNCKM